MTPERFRTVTSRYKSLRIAVVGDFCLDRYLEIDPSRVELSIETGLPVHNVIRVRSQPGGAGTIVNNLVALGIGEIIAIGFCGDDGEGYELRRELAALPGVKLDCFFTTADRATFTYTKPLVISPGRPPVELNRLDVKNWTPTPSALEARLAMSLGEIGPKIDALIVLDQVDEAGTGVVTRGLLDCLGELASAHPALPIIADSRRGLRDWPPVSFKMNAAELASLLTRNKDDASLDVVKGTAVELAARNGRPVFVTLSEQGIVVADPRGQVDHVPALPVRGPIDIVGAGDSVTANLAAAIASGASLLEATELASAAASLVIHQLGTTGTANVLELAEQFATRD
jgi:rfaE bifunctional protein kinase chain/domain